ncbi:glycosyltransferase [bacterium]|nr:glycosyltransferase [bacterium]
MKKVNYFSSYFLNSFKKKPKRSVVFLHNAYYNFFYLARALRDRGWDAVSVSVDPKSNPDYQFFHGEDINLWHDNPFKYKKNVEKFFKIVKRKYKMVHFYSMGRMSFFSENWDTESTWSQIPKDFMELKQSGIKIGYTHSGCLDMVSQSAFYKWSGGACDRCIHQLNPSICSDSRNLAWGKKIHQYCDLICIETDPIIDYKSGFKIFREPLTFAIDKSIWSDNLKIPPHLLFKKEKDEVIVYHAVGNYHTRTNETRNIKGTKAIVTAIENLRKKNYNVSLRFVTNAPSLEVRYIQAQCDIIVDQLNYGRYGATAREGMMLGKPVVCFTNKNELASEFQSECILETPLINATEESIEKVLEDLIQNPKKRKDIGQESRKHAIKWWSAESCAERYELVYDNLLKNFPVSNIPNLLNL